MKRKAISKRVRFEVFKRDAFTCQYCGRKAPEVILEMEHVHPVVAGGSNDILNLVTSCSDCNAGKSSRQLSDDSAIQKQRKELDALAERREQIEMMVRWRSELQKGTEVLIDSICSRIVDLSGLGVSDHGKGLLRKWLRTYPYDELMDGIEAAFGHYYEQGLTNDTAKSKSFGVAFLKIPNCCKVARAQKEKPYLHRLFYIRAILRNRVNYFEPYKALRLLEQAVLCNASLDSLEELCKTCKNWSHFQSSIEQYIAEHYGDQEKDA